MSIPTHASQRGIDIMHHVQVLTWLVRSGGPEHTAENIMRMLAEHLDAETAAAIYAGVTIGLTTTPPKVTP